MKSVMTTEGTVQSRRHWKFLLRTVMPLTLLHKQFTFDFIK